MKLRYVGELDKTLVDVASVTFGAVIDVQNDLGSKLLTAQPSDWECVDEPEQIIENVAQEDTRKDDAPLEAASLKSDAPRRQEEVTQEVSG